MVYCIILYYITFCCIVFNYETLSASLMEPLCGVKTRHLNFEIMFIKKRRKKEKKEKKEKRKRTLAGVGLDKLLCFSLALFQGLGHRQIYDYHSNLNE